MDLVLDIYQATRNFLERGGDVLLIIAGVVFVMWTLILDRLVYMNSEHPAAVGRALDAWRSRADTGSWHSEQIYDAMVSRLSIRLQTGIPMIKTLAAVCPLLGLLGTVTGMVLIFDAVSIVGSGSARAVAGGVSTAIVTTMAGLVGALTGIFPAAMLARQAQGQVKVLRAGHVDPSNAPIATPMFRMPRAVRRALVPVGGAVITVGVLFAMEQMIVTGKETLTAYTRGYPVDFVRVERTQTVEQRRRKPERLPPPEEMPTWMPEAGTAEDMTGILVTVAAPQVSLETTHRVSGFTGFVSDGDYLPILTVAPVYPVRAVERDLEGWVLLRFSLTASGAVKDIEVLESSNVIFARAAVAAAAKFKYRPRVVNGVPVEVSGVTNRIIFQLKGG